MAQLRKVWFFSDDDELVDELAAGAARLGEETAALYVGDRSKARGAKTVYYLGDGADDFEARIPVVAELVRHEAPDMLLVSSTVRGRAVAAAVAAAVGASACADASFIETEDGVRAGRMVYGGLAERVERFEGVAVVLAKSGLFKESAAIDPEEVRDVEASAPSGFERVGVRERQAEKVNLESARVLVGVGRGFSEESQLDLARELGELVGGELCCTRPISEAEGWMSKSRYVGVSGKMCDPEVYIACGISGQIQHMIGVNQAKLVVSVNSDKNAPIVSQSDYTIVGDICEVLPALSEALR